jgi:hypothetical protein
VSADPDPGAVPGGAPNAEQIAEQGRAELHARLRTAILRQVARAAEPVALSEADLDRLVAEAAGRAGGMLWRRCLAGAAAGALGIELADAVSHPLVQRAHELTGAPPYERAPEEPVLAAPAATTTDAAAESDAAGAAGGGAAGALRLAAVHLSGIESLRSGESDLELRISYAGLDLIKASSGAAIGRLLWSEIHDVDVAGARRGLRPGRRAQELHVSAQRGRASFELPGMSAEQVKEHLEPVLARVRGASP